MTFKKEIENSLEQVKVLEDLFKQVDNMEILPISFFSSSFDTIKTIATKLHCLELEQLRLMQEQIASNQSAFEEIIGLTSQSEEFVEMEEQIIITEQLNENTIVESEIIIESKEKEVKILADEIEQKTTLNDKFRKDFLKNG